MSDSGWLELRKGCFINPFSLEFFFSEKPPSEGPSHPPAELPLRTRAVQAVVTGRCNLKCGYCSARIAGGFQGDMSRETLKAVLEHSAPDVLLLVTGGEPLLCWETAAALIDGWRGQTVLFTNGSLFTRETAVFLKERGTALVVSMDGFERVHRIQRGDSWEGAARALDMARETGLPAGISMVAGAHNADTFPECMYWLLERFLPASFGVNIQHYTPEGFLPIPGTEYAGIIRSAFEFSMKTGVFVDQVARRLLPLVTGEFRHRDCAAQGGKLVYRPDGAVSSCVNTRRATEWGHRNPVNYPGCQRCPALGVCGGGCTWDGIHLSPDGEGPDPRNCEWTLALLDSISRVVEKKLPEGVSRTSRAMLGTLFGNISRRPGEALGQSLGHGQEKRS